jgi:hypothetical protein
MILGTTLPLAAFVIAAAWFGLFLAFAALVRWLGGAEALAGSMLLSTTQIGLEAAQAGMIAHAVVGTAWALRGAGRDLAELRPALGGEPQVVDRALRDATDFRPGPVAAAIALGAVGGVVLALHPANWPEGVRPASDDPVLWWATLRNTVMFGLIGRAAYLAIGAGARVSLVAGRLVRADLLDLRPLAPLVRNALRGVVILILWIVLISPLLFQGAAPQVAFGGLAFVLVLSVAALLGPVLGAQRRLHAAKRAELARVDAAIRREAATRSAAADGWQQADARVADLVAYRGLVDRVNTWLFDFPSLVKFTLIVLLGAGSWLGQALVERLLGAAID